MQSKINTRVLKRDVNEIVLRINYGCLLSLSKTDNYDNIYPYQTGLKGFTGYIFDYVNNNDQVIYVFAIKGSVYIINENFQESFMKQMGIELVSNYRMNKKLFNIKVKINDKPFIIESILDNFHNDVLYYTKYKELFVLNFYNHNMSVGVIYTQGKIVVQKFLNNSSSMVKEDLVIKMVGYDKFTITIGAVTSRVLQNDFERDINLRMKTDSKNGIIGHFVINKVRYAVYIKNKVLYATSKRYKYAANYRARLKYLMSKKSLYIFGIIVNKDADYLYIRNRNNRIAKIRHPFKFIGLKSISFIKIDLALILESGKVHHPLMIGNAKEVIHPFSLNTRKKDMFKETHRIINGMVVSFRLNDVRRAVISTMPTSQEYTKLNLFKNYLAAQKKMKATDIVVMFEKKSLTASESAIKVFETIQKNILVNNVYYVLDQENERFEELKNRHGSKVVAKYSYMHYKLVYNAAYLVSSELSNHLFNDRIFITSLLNRVREIPLVFLQHGIMLGKPIDNPLALGFHKENNTNNIYKSVVSSDLEKAEFYKMGYDDNDVIKTGLATLDDAKMNDEANKVVYMPTYRSWEENLIYSGNIHKTTYYHDLMNMINLFEKHNLIDYLILAPHNKFAKHIYEDMPEYAHLIMEDPGEALKVSKIFITDYSSAIYDAQYRGAYPIFFWKNRDYLITKYQAEPTLDETIASGPDIHTDSDLIEEVKEVLFNNKKLEPKYVQRYQKINEFSDDKNTYRIIYELMKLNII